MAALRPSRLFSLTSKTATAALVVLVTGIGAAVRLYWLGDQPVWLDETLTLVIAQWSFFDLWTLPVDPTPPFYYTLHKLAFREAIPSPTEIRLISFTAGVATIPVMYLLGRTVAGRTAGMTAAALIAVFGPHIEYSQEARAYAVLFLLVALSSLGLALAAGRQLRSEAAKSKRRLASLGLYAVAGALAFQTHYTGLYWLFVSQCLLLALWATERLRFSEVLGTDLFLALLCAPGLRLLFLQFGTDNFTWLEHFSFSAFLSTLRDLFLPANLWRFQPIPNIIAGSALVSGVLISSRFRVAGQLIGAFLVIPLLLWLTGFIKPVFMFRTALISSIGAVLAFAVLVQALPKYLGLIAAIALVLVFGESAHNFLQVREKEDWEEAAAFLDDNAGPDDRVVLCQSFLYPALRYYLPDTAAPEIVGIVSAHRVLRYPPPRAETKSWMQHDHEKRLQPQMAGTPVGVREQPAPDPENATWIVQSHCEGSHLSELRKQMSQLGQPKEAWRGTGIHIQTLAPAH